MCPSALFGQPLNSSAHFNHDVSTSRRPCLHSRGTSVVILQSRGPDEARLIFDAHGPLTSPWRSSPQQTSLRTPSDGGPDRQNHVMLVARPRRGVSKAQKAQAPQLVSTAALEGLPARIATGRRHVPRPRPGTIARMQIRQLMGIRALGVSMAATLRRRHQVAHKRKELPILRSCPSHQVMADPVSSMARPKLPPPPPALLSLEP